jgi:hypothetical protein
VAKNTSGKRTSIDRHKDLRDDWIGRHHPRIVRVDLADWRGDPETVFLYLCKELQVRRLTGLVQTVVDNMRHLPAGKLVDFYLSYALNRSGNGPGNFYYGSPFSFDSITACGEISWQI